MLASGAHVRLGDLDLLLETDQPGHYLHYFGDPQSFFSTQEAGPRVSHATLIHSNRYWFHRDWTAGEGSQEWGTDVDNSAYDQGYANTRLPGRLQTRPVRTTPPQAFLNPVLTYSGQPLQLASAGGNLWASWGSNVVAYSPDGVAWTIRNIAATVGAYFIQSICGDGPYLYILTYGSSTRAAGHPIIYRVTTTAITKVAQAFSSNMSAYSMVHSTGQLYFWSGQRLQAIDVTNPANFPYDMDDSSTNVFSATDDTDGPATYVDTCVTDRGIAMMSSWAGDTRIYEAWGGIPGVGLEVGQAWAMDPGFTGRTICSKGGVVYIGGEYQGRAAAWAISLSTGRQTAFLGFVRPWQSGAIVDVASGPGSQVMFLHSTQGVFIYDYVTDSFSTLDYHRSDDTNFDLQSVPYGASVAAFRGYRLAFLPPSSGAIPVISVWDHDLTQSSASGATTVVYSPSWDFGFAEMVKVSLGVEVQVQNPLGVSDSIKVDYLLEDIGIYNTFPSAPSAGSWTTLGTISHSDTTQIKYIDLSALGGATTNGGLAFRRLRLRYTLVGKPVLRQVSVRMQVPPGEERFSLLVRCRNYSATTLDPNSSALTAQIRSLTHDQIRDYIWSLARTKRPFLFLDGFPYGKGTKPNQYNTYWAEIEQIPEPEGDNIEVNGQGFMRVMLRRSDGNPLA